MFLGGGMNLGWILAAVLSFPVVEPATRTNLTVTAGDGTALHVLEYRYQGQARPTVILIGDRTEGTRGRNVDKLAEQLFHRGLDVVTWDRRGTGQSEGAFDFGRSDAGDLTAVLEAVARRSEQPVGILGLGTGGVAVLKGPHQSPAVGALALYGVGIHGVPYDGEGMLASLASPRSFSGRLWLRMRGVRLADDSGESEPSTAELGRAAAQIRRTPALYIAPGQFARVPAEDVRALFEAGRPPKEWLLAPQAGSNPPVFSMGARISDFFRKSLH